MIFGLDESVAPPPPLVMAYLRANGWESLGVKHAWGLFRLMFEGEELVLEVPLKGEAPDYPRRFLEVLRSLCSFEHRSPATILREIQTSTSDLIKVRFRGAEDGRISIEQGARAFQRTRELLLAAACAAVEPRPVYSRRKPAQAVEYLGRTRFGPTETGSFVLTVESMVPPLLREDDPTSDQEPYDRAVGLTLARAASEARHLVDDVAMTGAMSPLEERVRRGVSSNLCEALAGLVELGAAQPIDLMFRWASSRPVSNEVPRLVTFERDAAPVLAEMGRTLREQSTIEEFELIGPVHELSSVLPGNRGEVTVAMLDPWPGRKIRVQLPGPLYQEAVQAHAARWWISCEGELTRQGSAHVLINPRNFRVLPMNG